MYKTFPDPLNADCNWSVIFEEDDQGWFHFLHLSENAKTEELRAEARSTLNQLNEGVKHCLKVTVTYYHAKMGELAREEQDALLIDKTSELFEDQTLFSELLSNTKRSALDWLKELKAIEIH